MVYSHTNHTKRCLFWTIDGRLVGRDYPNAKDLLGLMNNLGLKTLALSDSHDSIEVIEPI